MAWIWVELIEMEGHCQDGRVRWKIRDQWKDLYKTSYPEQGDGREW